jgi:hypothetical protein
MCAAVATLGSGFSGMIGIATGLQVRKNAYKTGFAQK